MLIQHGDSIPDSRCKNNEKLSHCFCDILLFDISCKDRYKATKEI